MHGRSLFPEAAHGAATISRRRDGQGKMTICHEHNLSITDADAARPFGIRVRLLPTDPFRKLVGDDWQTEHWYPTRRERDLALAEMRKRHSYSRIGDEPSLAYEAIER